MKKLCLVPTGIILCSLTCFTSDGQSFTHTNTPIELTSISSLSVGAYQVASICFLGSGNCEGTNSYDLDTIIQCQNGGYNKTECLLPQYLSGQCPYNDKYYAQCLTDNNRACSEGGYLSSCSSGQILDMTQVCPYDSSYQKCKCNPCAGYDYTLAQATSTGYVTDGSCMSCAETKYKRKSNPCSGYTTCECGGAIGTTTCTTGTQTKYQSCKSCCGNKCTLAFCPSGAICNLEACSNKYCETGCREGFIFKNGSCVSDGASCSIGWIYYNDGTCGAPAGYTSSKVALGVVVYVNRNGVGGQVLTKDFIGIYEWGGYSSDAPVSEATDWQTAQRDYDSCGNTSKLLGDSRTTYPAASAAWSYAPTPETKGKWCLPAAGVISSWYVNRTSIDVGIAKLGGTQLGSSDPHTWSSSEYDFMNAWFLCTSELGRLMGNGKGIKHYVRPVLEF